MNERPQSHEVDRPIYQPKSGNVVSLDYQPIPKLMAETLPNLDELDGHSDFSFNANEKAAFPIVLDEIGLGDVPFYAAKLTRRCIVNMDEILGSSGRTLRAIKLQKDIKSKEIHKLELLDTRMLHTNYL